MRSRCLLPGLLLIVALAADAQQSNPSTKPSSGATAQPKGETQPQVWPPPQPPAQEQRAPAAASAPSASQNPVAAAGHGLAAGQATSREIELVVVVNDKAGHAISGLERGDFTLLDNNHPTQIDSFNAFSASTPEPQPPQQIVLVIDGVNIAFQEVSYARLGIDKFLRSNGGRLPAPMWIYWYTDDGLAGAEGPATDGNALADQFDAAQGRLRMLTAAAGTWGAIERFDMSVQTLDKLIRVYGAKPGRKLVIWLGRGWPMLQDPHLQMSWKDQQRLFGNIVELNTIIRQAHMSIYSVTPEVPGSYSYLYEEFVKGVKNPSHAFLPNLDLKVLAEQSGGVVVNPSNDLDSQLEQCVQDTKAYYVIGFTPPPGREPDEYHELKVRVDKPGLTARTSTGYYNEPVGGTSR